MTKDEAIKFINSIEYEFKSSVKIWSKLYAYKDENLQLLREIQSIYPSLVIYEKINKFRLMRDIYGTPVRDSYRSHDYECGIY